MKKTVILSLCSFATLLAVQTSEASVNFYDNFDSYVNGNLAGTTQNTIGQGTWAQTSTSSATPIQVLGGAVVLGTSGQDVYSALTTPLNFTDGQTFYIGATVDITAAQAAGDYFLHWSSPAGTTSIFTERFYAKSDGSGGFVFGYDGSSGGTVNYSPTSLSLNTSYRVVLAYTAVAGAVNDTFALYVNPTDLSVQANNTPYMTSAYVGTGAEVSPQTVSAINFRQGSAANAPSVIIDNLTVATLFSDAAPIAPVPEPTTIALAGLGGLAGLLAFRRRK
jgi:hypothetical protein